MAKPAVAAPETVGPGLVRLKKMLSESFSLTMEARRLSERDIDYYDSKQFTPEEKAILAARGQPDTVHNHVKRAVNGILGVVQRGKADPRAYPREPGDDDASDVATDTLRYIADHNRFHRLKIVSFKDMLVAGSMAAIIEVDDDRNVVISQIRWEELVYDPRSRKENFSDARYLGVAKWMYVDDVAAQYPDHAEELEISLDSGELIFDTSAQDRPNGSAGTWVDRKNRRVMLVELYSREKIGWVKTCFYAGGILSQEPSPYLDEKKRPICPIEAQSAYVDRDNNRYGEVRDMIGPQDGINKRLSKLLYHASTSQVQAVDPSAIGVDAETVRNEAARPDGVLPFGWQKVPTTDMAAGQAELLKFSLGEMDRQGPNPATLGRQGADSSGRAVLARQEAGLVELALLYGGLEEWELRIYVQCWARVKQYWTAPMYIRVTDDENAPRYVGLNQPQHEMGPVLHGETGQPIPDPKTGEPQQAPVLYPQQHPETGAIHMMPNVLGYKNAVGEMDVDITVDTTPSSATLQQEQFQILAQLAGSNPLYAQQVPIKTMIGLSASPRKRQLIDELDAYAQQQQQSQAAAQQMQQQIAMAAAKANIDKTNSETTLNTAKAASTHAGVVLDAHDQALAAFAAIHPVAGAAPLGSTGATGYSGL